MNVNFFGVRGSTPCACRELARYGGNTACVALEAPGHDPVVFDLGTGLRFWGETQPQDGSFRGAALVSHLHWDHVQGLPFFVPVLRPGARLDIYGPPPEEMSLEEAFRQFLRPPFFPVEIDALHGEIAFHDLFDEPGGGRRRQGHQPAPCPTSGARRATASSTPGSPSPTSATTRRPPTAAWRWPTSVLELADGADLLIHDAQYTPRGVRREGALGPLHDRLRGERGRPGRGPAPGAVPPRPVPRRRHPRRARGDGRRPGRGPRRRGDRGLRGPHRRLRISLERARSPGSPDADPVPL